MPFRPIHPSHWNCRNGHRRSFHKRADGLEILRCGICEREDIEKFRQEALTEQKNKIEVNFKVELLDEEPAPNSYPAHLIARAADYLSVLHARYYPRKERRRKSKPVARRKWQPKPDSRQMGLF